MHIFSGTGLYSNHDSFFGVGSSETFPAWSLHSWGREDQWQTQGADRDSHSSEATTALSESTPLLQTSSVVDPEKQVKDLHADIQTSEGLQIQDTRDNDLVVDISPTSDYWDQKYAAAHELF